MKKFILIAIGLLLAYSVIVTVSLSHQKKLVDEKDNILETTEQLYVNRLGEKTSETKVWSVRYNQLKDAHEKSLVQGERNISEYEAKLNEAYKNVELYKRKEKDLISYYSARLDVNDTIYTVMSGDCMIEPVRSPHIDIDFPRKNDSIGVAYHYHTGISTLVSLYPKRKKNGNKHFPNWGFIWGWDKNSITKTDDPNASLTNQVSLEFKR